MGVMRHYGVWVWVVCRCRGGGGVRGGGVLCLEKGTDYGPTAAERWLSQLEMTKKRGMSSYHNIV